MSRRNRLAVLLGIPVALVAAAVALWLLWPRIAITPENGERIRLGMTRSEVEEILGGPPGDYAGPEAFAAAGRCGDPMDARAVIRRWSGEPDERWQQWLSDDALVLVHLDAHGRVSATHVYSVSAYREPLLDRLRRWLGL